MKGQAMKARGLGWWMLVAVVVCISSACGGGGTATSAPAPATVAAFYSDVRGYEVEPGAEKVAVTQWPSWLHEKELLSPCNEGEISYGDRCWGSMAIDVDGGAVTFTGLGGQSERLALGDGPPAALGTMVQGCQGATDGWSCLFPHHDNTGYVYMAETGSPGWTEDSLEVWGTPIGVPSDLGRPCKRSPWVLGTRLDTLNGAVGGFLVKTTQMYGFQATKLTPLSGDYKLMHNWSYAGTVRVGGKDVTLPAHLSDIAAATGGAVRVKGSGEYIVLGGGKVLVASDQDVLAARAAYGGSGVGLTDGDLVTSIQFTANPWSTWGQ
jgi:hypothetical protein